MTTSQECSLVSGIKPTEAIKTNPFNKLAIETNQHIASYLEADSDIANFRLICQSTNDAIDADNESFWRRRFVDKYDKPSWTEGGNRRYKKVYQDRRQWLRNTNLQTFDIGETITEKKCLGMLKELIIESFSDMPQSSDLTHESRNLVQIRQFVLSNNLLKVVFRPAKKQASRRKKGYTIGPTRLLQTIQIMLAPELLSLNTHMLKDHYLFPESQIAAYGTKDTHPLFQGYGQDINMEFILHNLNFWKYHMIREEELTLYPAFKALEDHERPKYWSEQLREGPTTLGKKWKGSYSFVDHEDIIDVRNRENHDGHVSDEFNGEFEIGAFQDLQLTFVDDKDALWPMAFEHAFQSETTYSKPPKTRAQRRFTPPDEFESLAPVSFSFEGDGRDQYEDFLASGKLSALQPQEGIPGWQRLTMMKYFTDPATDAVDFNSLWAYEGIVLPGGQIVLGRWWNASQSGDEEMYSGPFILWCVDSPGDTK